MGRHGHRSFEGFGNHSGLGGLSNGKRSHPRGGKDVPVVAILAELATLCMETSPGPEDIETSADAASCIWRATRLVA